MELTPPPSSSSAIRPSLISPIARRARSLGPAAAEMTTQQIEDARTNSLARVLDVWSKLADRYTVPIEEDDIVDISTGRIVQDRGVLRGIVPRQFGGPAAVDDAETDAEDEVDDELELEEEESDDELGRWPGDEDQSRPNPDAVARMQWLMEGADAEDNPRDKADLESFLRAERERQRTVGHDDGDDDGSTDHRASATESDVEDDLDAPLPLVYESDQDDPEGGNVDYGSASESEDELLLMDDNDVLEVDPVHPPPPSSPTPAPSPSKSRIRTPAQLYTPPRSQSIDSPRRVSSTSPLKKRPEPAPTPTRIFSTPSKQSNAAPFRRPAQVMEVVMPLREVHRTPSAARRPPLPSPSPSSSAEPPPKIDFDEMRRVRVRASSCAVHLSDDTIAK
ncbi:hypothetical protein EXIGLDRAFT_273556 [Exidia glandulosa HHB12029]|uniref:Uncharacterized protein n=1 Tax=Exidia glandulosa HHB12029 TaxID=1314781 RepID=A0A165M6W2_EXIGL|nr:hypothetical protein EXIGLDRAFT_273556 [Exidia glandulosa HHB12029]